METTYFKWIFKEVERIHETERDIEIEETPTQVIIEQIRKQISEELNIPIEKIILPYVVNKKFIMGTIDGIPMNKYPKKI